MRVWWLFVGLALATAPAQQTVCPVDAPGTCDHDTLADALAAGATEVLLLAGDHAPGGTITLDGTHVDGEAGARIVGTPGGGLPQLQVTAAEVVVESLTLLPTGDAVPAAAIEILGTGHVTLERVTLEGNGASARSGVQVRDDATLVVQQSTLTGLDLVAIDHDSTGRLEVIDSVFEGNGGSIRALTDGATTVVHDAYFCGNTHTAVELHNCGGPDGCELFDVVFAGNSAGPQSPAALYIDGYPRLDRVTFTANDGTDGGVIALGAVSGSVAGTLFLDNTGVPQFEILREDWTFVSWGRLGSDVAANELVAALWDRPDAADLTLLDAELVPHPTRCPSFATLPVCDSVVNAPLYAQRIGYGSDDRDQDGVSRFCDCDGDDNIEDDGEDCPDDTGSPPSDDTGEPGESTDTADTGVPTSPPIPTPDDSASGCGVAKPTPALLLPVLRRRRR